MASPGHDRDAANNLAEALELAQDALERASRIPGKPKATHTAMLTGLVLQAHQTAQHARARADSLAGKPISAPKLTKLMLDAVWADFSNGNGADSLKLAGKALHKILEAQDDIAKLTESERNEAAAVTEALKAEVATLEAQVIAQERAQRAFKLTQGPQGESGKDGEQGSAGKDGRDGQQGEPGERGEQGPKGDTPDHEWIGTALRFEKPDGTWGETVDLRGPKGSKGATRSGGGRSSGATFDPSTLPTASDSLIPSEVLVQQDGQLVRMPWAQFVGLIGGSVGTTVNGEFVTVNGETVYVNGE